MCYKAAEILSHFFFYIKNEEKILSILSVVVWTHTIKTGVPKNEGMII